MSKRRGNDKHVLVLGGFERLVRSMAGRRGRGYVTKHINKHDYWYKWKYNPETQKHDWTYVGPVGEVNPHSEAPHDPLAKLDYEVIGEDVVLPFGDWKRFRQHFAGCVAIEWREA